MYIHRVTYVNYTYITHTCYTCQCLCIHCMHARASFSPAPNWYSNTGAASFLVQLSIARTMRLAVPPTLSAGPSFRVQFE